MILRINLLLLLNLPITFPQFFRAPQFDCSRIHPSYCCSTRVRFSCPQLCNSRPCQRTPTFVQPFSPHIPPTLPFVGLAPQQSQLPSQPQSISQPDQIGQTLPPLIDPLALTPSNGRVHSFVSQPNPPPGIILPPEETPLSIGTPIPEIDGEERQTGFRSNSQRPIDSFASSRGGHSTIGAGGRFEPTEQSGNSNSFNGHLVGMGSDRSKGNLTNTFLPSNQFQSTIIPPTQQNTFPTLINFVPTTSQPSKTVNPPAIAPPWPSVFVNSNIFTASPQIQTSTSSVPSFKPTSTAINVVDSNSHRVSRKKAILPPPNNFTATTGNEELVELESTDRRSIHVESSGATAKIDRFKDSSVIDGLAEDISNTIIVGTNTFPPPITNLPITNLPITNNTLISTTPITTIQEQVEPLPRTTVSDKGFGGWSFKISPSKHARELQPEPTRNEGEFTNLNSLNSSNTDFTSSNQWISNQRPSTQFAKNEAEFKDGFTHLNVNQSQGTTVKQTPPPNNGLFSGDRLNGVIDSIFTRRTIDTITSLTGRRPTQRKGNHRQTGPITGSITASPPISTNFNQTTQKFINHNFNNSVRSENQQCGVAPDFRPCLDINRANLRLLSCCRSKLLPEGCWPLCRYNTTQADVKKIFDAGKCGILNVAPFLDCASQGQDNRPCCQQRQLTAKSGPHCEVFCHPRDGLGSLSLQHLSCQNVISDLLQCHHSGLRD